MLFTAEPLEYAMVIFPYLYNTPPPFVLFFPIATFVMYSLPTQPQTFLRYMKLITDLKPAVNC